MRCLWAYAYQIVPAQPSSRLGTIRTLLKEETAAARGGARAWSGRLVLERWSTRILIVSDGPEQNRGIDHSLKAELTRLKTKFFLTEPMAIRDDTEAVAGEQASGGNGR